MATLVVTGAYGKNSVVQVVEFFSEGHVYQSTGAAKKTRKEEEKLMLRNRRNTGNWMSTFVSIQIYLLFAMLPSMYHYKTYVHAQKSNALCAFTSEPLLSYFL